MRVFLLLLWLCCSSLVSATVFRCADANGKISYQTSPCESLDSAAEFNVTTGSHRNIQAEIDEQTAVEKENLTKEQKQQLDKLRKKAKRQKLYKDSAEQAQINQTYIKNNIKSFSPYAIPPYHGKNYAHIIRDFLPRLPEIERYRRLAAAKVLLNGDCRRVEVSELDFYSHISLLSFNIDCRNGKRFKFKEQALQDQEALPIPRPVEEPGAKLE